MLFEKIKLEDDEKVLRIVHKHWFVIFTRTISIIGTALVPLIAWIGIGIFLDSGLGTITVELNDYQPHFMFFYSAWLLFNWVMFAHMVTDHHLDINQK